MSDSKTYFITWTTYGTWLPGDQRGSFVDDRLTGPGTSSPKPHLAQASHNLLKHPPIVLGDDARLTVDAAIRQHCSHRGWALLALNVRTNHVHLVVTADRTPEKVMSELKARATRLLREAGRVDPASTVWTRHGSTRHVQNENSRREAIRYVLECQ